MVRFEKLSANKVYPYVDATVAADYKNGTFGTVTAGVFTAGAGFTCIMQVEKGDDAKSDAFVVKKDEHARVADLATEDGQIVDITENILPGSGVVAKAKLEADSNGVLKVNGSPAGSYLEVVEKTPFGCRAKIVVVVASATIGH